MDYRRVEYFLAVVDAGTITAAAEELRIAQPALSRQMKSLERDLHMQLFEPQGNRLALTRAGQKFVGVARTLLTETRNAELTAESLRLGKVESLVVSATSASVHSVIAPFIATTTEADPVLLTRVTSHYDIYESLTAGSDIAFSPAPVESGLDYESLGRIPIRAWVGLDHPWADGRGRIHLSDLVGQRLILPSRGSVSRNFFDAAISMQDLSIGNLYECDDNPTILSLASAGHGIGVSSDLSKVSAVPLEIDIAPAGSGQPPELLQLPLYVAWRPGHYASATIRQLAIRLHQFLDAQLLR